MFADLIQQQFCFLVDLYGSVLARAENDIVEYVSIHCHVMVVVDRDSTVAITLRSTEPEIERRARLTLWEFLYAKESRSQFTYDGRHFEQDPLGTVEAQLNEQARFLREQCDEILRGDFSIRSEIEALSGEYITEIERIHRERINRILEQLRGERH